MLECGREGAGRDARRNDAELEGVIDNEKTEG